MRALAVWAASGMFTAWVAGWRAQHDARLGYIMILMFLLALASTVTLAMKIADHDEIHEEQAERALRADQILKAMADMAEALTSARLSAVDDADERMPRARTADGDPRLRLVITGKDQE